MRFRGRNFVTVGLSLGIFVGLFGRATHAVVDPIESSRLDYTEAVEAIDKGSWTEYQQLRPGLDDYPLAIYLDYFQLSRQADQVRPAEARRFISLSDDSPLPNRFLSTYLHRAGKSRRWADFLSVSPNEPNSIDLKCYYFRAQLAGGDPLAAWEGAERLWVYGKSRPKQCDPLFDAWLKAGQVSDEVVWARLLKAFDARQRSLMTYVAKKGTQELRPWSDRLIAVYRAPEKMRQQTLPGGDSRSADIASHGLAYLARYNPAKSRLYWDDYQSELSFTPEQTHEVEYAIALRSLFAREESQIAWLDSALARLKEDKLVEIRLRWILLDQDWAGLQQMLSLLSEEARGESVWRYWEAVAQEQLGDTEGAKKVFATLSGERGYYSFLAADRLERAYAFNHQPLVLEASGTAPLKEMPAVQRIEELYYHDEGNLAHSEWFKVLGDTEDVAQQQQLAFLASEQGWHRLAIDAANRAKAWDALDMRFPTPYQNTFEHYATIQRVPSTELMAIARRESAFLPHARSSVGARGLMQIMPATGRQVAKSLGRPHNGADLYEVEHNVLLGSAYYRQLLDRFEGNRVFALTAYNAGPHRVDRWRNDEGEELPVELWIETIPYKETRNYVQAVLSYNVVFQYLRGDSHSLLSPAERSASY